MFAAASLIFEVEHWSRLKQTCLHFVITTVPFMFAGIAAGWYALNIVSIVGFIFIYLIIYIVVCFIMQAVWRNQINKINRCKGVTKHER
ncbi:DUF3021 family protein, partial [Paenibacillus sp. OSY-SE]|uniref:DUF3021 family protein n=1 Tax=Paenibacillus sp. OSY-SE TaxID=1196323 RepID=UPI000568A880